MSEGQNFEKHETSPQPTEFLGRLKHDHETTPNKIDILSILERGEIVHAETLEGHFPIKVVTIKDDGRALFRPDGFTYERLEKKENLRTELEILAYSVDQVLEFGMVPPVVQRELSEGKKGTFQKFVENAKPAFYYEPYWSEVVVESEILKAAVFDFLIDARDRHSGNFLIDPDLEKIWLIDHDLFMFEDSSSTSHIIDEAVARNLTELSEEMVEAIQKLYDKVNHLSPISTDPRIQKILTGIKTRARKLLDDRKIKIEEI